MKNYVVAYVLNGQKALFTCSADDVGHAIEQAKNAYPNGDYFDAWVDFSKLPQSHPLKGLQDAEQVIVAFTGAQVKWLHALMTNCPCANLTFEYNPTSMLPKITHDMMPVIADQLEQCAENVIKDKDEGDDLIRWDASVFYRHDFNTLEEATYQLVELGDIQNEVECGPSWDCIQVIEIRRVAGTKLMTVEEAEKL